MSPMVHYLHEERRIIGSLIFALSTGFDLMELIISMGRDLLGDSGFLLPNALKQESEIVVVGLCSLFNILVHWLEAML